MLYADVTQKADIPQEFSGPPAGWDAEDWLTFFDERDGVYQHDAGLSLEEAEERAWQSCRVLALTYIAKLSPIVGTPSPTELISITAGRIRAADELLAQIFRERRAAA